MKLLLQDFDTMPNKFLRVLLRPAELECWKPFGQPVEGWKLVGGPFIIDGKLTFVTVEEQIANMTEERKKELGIE